MLDALYQDGTNRVLDDLQARPVPRPAPEPGFWAGVWSAAPRGLAVGINETVRTGYRAITANADNVMRRQQQDADDFTADAIFKRRLELADDRAQTDAQLRAAVDYWQPDPGTVGAAAEGVQNFARFAGKAVGYSLAFGPVAGAALTGADIGGAEYLSLRDQGVDEATAAKVGAVRGLAAGVTVALPVAGKGVASTTALIAAGGPGAFVAEQAAARKILADADYTKLAEQIDPFDPTGLSVATAAATLFGVGAYALRGAGRAKPKADPGAEPAPVPPQEAVDAAHIVLAKDVAEQQALARPGDLAADAIERRAQERTVARMAAGERVDVADTVPLREGDPLPAPLADMIARTDEVAAAQRAEDASVALAQRQASQSDQSARGSPDETQATSTQAGDRAVDRGTADAAGQRPAADVVYRTVADGDPAQGWLGATRIRRTDGQPVTVYRGAGRELTATDFEDASLGFATKQPSSGLGVWFALNEGEAGRYGRVEPFQLDVRNPKVIKVEDLPGFDSVADAKKFREALAARGHDGIIISAKHVGGPVHMVAFRPEQVIRGKRSASSTPTTKAPERSAAAATAGPEAWAIPGDALPEVAAARAVPDIEVELPDGTRTTAAEALRTVQEQAAAEVADAQLLQVAAACAIGV